VRSAHRFATTPDGLRLLYVLDTLLVGGAEALVTQWASALAARGHHVDVCVLYASGPLQRELSGTGVRVFNLALDPDIERQRSWRKYDVRGVARLARIIRQGRYDVVHAHLFPASLFVAIASLAAPGPQYVFSEHNAHNRRRSRPLFKLLDAAIYSRYVHVLAVSEGVGDALREWLPALERKIGVLTNTVNEQQLKVMPEAVERTRTSLGLSPDHHVILFAGRLTEAKGPDILVEAVRRMQPIGRPLRVLMAGDGPMAGAVRRLVAEAGVGDRISLLGTRHDIPALLKLSDMLVMPSRWEGLPMVLLEAMVAGTPVLATRTGGIPEVLTHDASGWLVPPEDASTLADAATYLLRSPERRVRLAAHARETYDARFSFAATMTRLVAAYRAILGKTDASTAAACRLAG
jgi:glycosyltransferase involved in cell wall biosynthesis